MKIENEVKPLWLGHVQDSSASGMRLFCFPYAGGSAGIFRGWQKLLTHTVNIYPVELPGHGQHFRTAPHTRLAELIPAAADALLPFLDQPFAFYGHSMGALIAFELACYLKTTYKLEPSQLLVSGRAAPQIVQNRTHLHNLSEPELLAELKRLKGTPLKLLDDFDAIAFWLPVLRADFALVAGHVWSHSMLTCPIVAYGGLQDEDVPRSSIAAWRDVTSGEFCLRMMQGDHFFILNSRTLFLELVAQDLNGMMQRQTSRDDSNPYYKERINNEYERTKP
jgi:medium-chain acyl-[acyl-carrier-protein] hydrolase